MKKSLITIAAFAAIASGAAFAGEIDYATVATQPVQASTSRETVKAEAIAAVARGQLATGEVGVASDAVRPVAVRTPVADRADLAQALRHGQLNHGEAGV